MKKKYLTLLSILAMAAGLAGCGENNKPTEKPTPTEPPVSETSKKPEDVKLTTTEAPVAGFDDLGPKLENDPIPAPTADPAKEAEALPEGAQVREFNSNFDQMVNDFSTALDAEKVSGATVKNDKPYLNVRVNSANEVFPHNEDASIYKCATGSYAIQEGYSIGFRMKLHDAKTVGLDHLVLALRGDDKLSTYQIALNNAKDPDGEDLPALTGEYQDFVISPMATISNELTPYKDLSGGYSQTTVLSKILGFHLYAAGNVDATIDIESVFLRKSGVADAVLDNFEHAKPNDGDPNLYWRDSTGTIIGRNVTVKGNGSYSETVDAEKARENLVINAKGDSSTASVIFYNGETAVTKTWAELHDSSDAAIPAVLKNSYSPLVINLAKSGIDFVPTKIEVKSTNELTINKMFFSNLETKETEEYPAIDTDSIKVFDDFNRLQSGFNGDYDASFADPIVKAAGLDYILSYNNGNLVTVDGSALVFDGTTLGATDYINLKIGSDAHARTNEQYMVLATKLSDGATFDNFRIVDAGGAHYANDWKAGFGVKSLETPYTKDDGYSLMVIDLEETGMDITNAVDMYYTGAGKLMIDQIFFANDYSDLEMLTENAYPEIANKTADTSGYAYQSGGNVGTETDVVALHLKGDGTSDLSSLRMECNGVTQWIKDSGLIDPYGNPITNHVLSTEGEVIYVDLEKSGMRGAGNNDLHIHAGGIEGSRGVITYLSIDTMVRKDVTREVATLEATDLSTYKYIGWAGPKENTMGKAILKIEAKGDGTATLDSFRIGTQGYEYWFNTDNNDARKPLYLADGTVTPAGHVISAEGETFEIDLVKSGIKLDGEVHLHIGGSAGVLTSLSVKLVSDVPTYEALYNLIYTA